MSTTSARGVLGNALYTGWSAFLAVATVPVLVRTLGLEAYGIVGLLLSAQALIFALDLGLSAAVNRFVARYQARAEVLSARDLIASAAPVYAGFSLLTLLLMGVSAKWIAAHWLVVEQVPIDVVTGSIALIGAIVAVRFWLTLYQSALIGAGRVDLSSMVGLAMITIAQLGGLLVVLLTVDVQLYLLWLLACAALQWWLLRRFTWTVLHHESTPQPAVGVLGRVMRFALGMAGVSITGMLLTQADRIVLSRSVALGDFAAYALCWSLASGLYIIMTPAFNYIAPRFAAAVAVRDYDRLQGEYRQATRIFAALLLPAAVLGMLCASSLLLLFSGEQEVADTMRLPLMLLLAGTALNGMMHFPYAMQLAHGRSRLALGVNVVLCVLFVPALLLLVEKYAVVGAALAWLLVNAVYVLLGLVLTHRYLEGLPALGAWLGRDVAPGLLCALVVLLPPGLLLSSSELGAPVFLLVMGAAALGCSVLALRFAAGVNLADLRNWSLG